MLPIGIDLTDVIEEFYLMADEVSALETRIVDRFIDEYMFKWEDNINDSLHSTRSEYKKAMYVERISNGKAVIGLTPTESQLALMREEGCSPFDLKEGFLKSNKKTETGNGHWYITIPFRHATADALAESPIFSGKMPKEVQDVVKSKPMIDNKTKGLTFNELPSAYQKLMQNKTTGYEHKNPIYEGLIRVNTASTDKEKRSGYFTFRRVSDNSDKDSWWHSGFNGLKLMEKTLDEIDIGRIVDEELQIILKK